MSGWGVQQIQGAEGAEKPVSLLIAAPPERAQGLYAAFIGDARFNVLAIATSTQDVVSKLAMKPEAIVVEAIVFPDPQAFAHVLGAYEGSCFVILPFGVPADAQEAVRAVRCVRDIVVGDPNFPILAGKIYDAVIAARKARLGPAFPAFTPQFAMAGWRAIAVWSPQGGVGKSTIATSLALEAANRRLPTLLVGLGAPDIIPLRIGLRPEPNIMTWKANPSVEGLRGAMQKFDILDVLAGFPDSLSMASYVSEAMDGQTGLVALASNAAYAGYSVVIFDVSSQELAASALSAANTLVLVVRPSLDGALGAIEAIRLLNDVMAGQHKIAKEAMHIVINRVRRSTMTPEEIIRTVQGLRPDFPPLAAWIPDDPAIEEAENNRRPAYFQSEHLRQAVKILGDRLFAQAVRPTQEQIGKAARVLHLGPVRIKM